MGQHVDTLDLVICFGAAAAAVYAERVSAAAPLRWQQHDAARCVCCRCVRPASPQRTSRESLRAVLRYTRCDPPVQVMPALFTDALFVNVCSRADGSHGLCGSCGVQALRFALSQVSVNFSPDWRARGKLNYPLS
jgi:hypothetical protein